MKVSVIVPVYNVCQWIDECMESLASQTFTDFEVLLINDGSTDGSGDKCKAWEMQDSRFRVLEQPNSGPSIARNYGISEAKGDYLSFVDSDDWVHKDFLKLLVQAAVENDADMVECDVIRVDDRTKEETYRSCSGSMGKKDSLIEHMKYGYTPIWKCLFRRSLFEKYQVYFPNCHSEAKAIYPLLLALSNRLINVEKGLYYYRRFRKDSLTDKPRANKGDEFEIGIRAFNELIKGFERTGMYSQYEDVIESIIKYKLSDMLAASFYRKDIDEYKKLAIRYKNYLKEKYPQATHKDYITFGGYNLNKILWSMNFLHDSCCRFNFSSIISVANSTQKELTYKHKNNYRSIMIQRDMKATFWEILSEIQPEYLCMDFLEERFDILQFQGSYLTKSDAFDGAELQEDLSSFSILSRNSKECTRLWKESCVCFFDRVFSVCPNIKVVIVKNYLCDTYGNLSEKHTYEQKEYIQRTNLILKEYYSFVETLYPQFQFIDASTDELYFTDANYEYGKEPTHLNDLINRKIAAHVEKYMLEG